VTIFYPICSFCSVRTEWIMCTVHQSKLSTIYLLVTPSLYYIAAGFLSCRVDIETLNDCYKSYSISVLEISKNWSILSINFYNVEKCICSILYSICILTVEVVRCSLYLSCVLFWDSIPNGNLVNNSDHQILQLYQKDP